MILVPFYSQMRRGETIVSAAAAFEAGKSFESFRAEVVRFTKAMELSTFMKATSLSVIGDPEFLTLSFVTTSPSILAGFQEKEPANLFSQLESPPEEIEPRFTRNVVVLSAGAQGAFWMTLDAHDLGMRAISPPLSFPDFAKALKS